jgi:hypothetical protein
MSRISGIKRNNRFMSYAELGKAFVEMNFNQLILERTQSVTLVSRKLVSDF